MIIDFLSSSFANGKKKTKIIKRMLQKSEINLFCVEVDEDSQSSGKLAKLSHLLTDKNVLDVYLYRMPARY